MGLADDFGNLDYVAREVVKAEEVLDYTPRDNVAERLAKRFGAAIGSGAVKALRDVADLAEALPKTKGRRPGWDGGPCHVGVALYFAAVGAGVAACATGAGVALAVGLASTFGSVLASVLWAAFGHVFLVWGLASAFTSAFTAVLRRHSRAAGGCFGGRCRRWRGGGGSRRRSLGQDHAGAEGKDGSGDHGLERVHVQSSRWMQRWF